MKTYTIRAATLFATFFLIASGASAADPDYSVWNTLLSKYYDPARGMDYQGLKSKDAATLTALRQSLAKVNVSTLTPKEQLAYWINLYNVNVVGIVVDKFPVKSIRDISTDPIVRLNVFKKDYVPFGNGKMSLNDVENTKIRDGFKDARIHFAINCAAKSCPPIRTEAYTGAGVDAQLDDQTRRFLNGSNGVRLGKKGDTVVIHATKVMDWFGKDFDQWGGGKVAFLRKYVSDDKARTIDAAGKKIKIEFDEYSWDLNNRAR
ncbi:MAG TPA: DUF547 domain-containing protein [Thermoanaerobaculia bacterium]|nr:DUF547 domain-containing protein [Thermoanaerobaculia bacterium]